MRLISRGQSVALQWSVPPNCLRRRPLGLGIQTLFSFINFAAFRLFFLICTCKAAHGCLMALRPVAPQGEPLGPQMSESPGWAAGPPYADDSLTLGPSDPVSWRRRREHLLMIMTLALARRVPCLLEASH